MLGGTITDCRVRDTGGGGLLVGGIRDPERPTRGVRILRNQACAKEGMWAGARAGGGLVADGWGREGSIR